jgi:hypothetical protein
VRVLGAKKPLSWPFLLQNMHFSSITGDLVNVPTQTRNGEVYFILNVAGWNRKDTRLTGLTHTTNNGSRYCQWGTGASGGTQQTSDSDPTLAPTDAGWTRIESAHKYYG